MSLCRSSHRDTSVHVYTKRAVICMGAASACLFSEVLLYGHKTLRGMRFVRYPEVRGCSYLGGIYKCTESMLRSVGGRQFVHSTEVVHFPECPLSEVPLYREYYIYLPLNAIIIPPTAPYLQGTMIHSLPHSKPDAGGRACVVYSLCYHHKEPCLLTAGSFGPVKVWKSPNWEAMAEEEEEAVE